MTADANGLHRTTSGDQKTDLQPHCAQENKAGAFQRDSVRKAGTWESLLKTVRFPK